MQVEDISQIQKSQVCWLVAVSNNTSLGMLTWAHGKEEFGIMCLLDAMGLLDLIALIKEAHLIRPLTQLL
jgi:hypothetical protein